MGVFVGTLIGVLPGIGPVGTMSLLLPATFHLSPVGAIIMLAGIYYGAQYGGSTTSILVNIPGEASSIVTCLDGYQMARQGRAGPALGMSALGSFIGGFRHEGPEEHFPVFHWKPNFYVLGAVVIFGIILKWVGMLLAGIILVLIACKGSKDFQLRRSIILAVILTIFCALVFVFGLKLPIPLCPDLESLQSLPGCRG